jgi:hypothetical protein
VVVVVVQALEAIPPDGKERTLMNDEKPSEHKVDGRPFDGGVGPTVQATEGVPIGRPQLSANQLRGDTTTPSWKAPREAGHRWSAQRIIVLVILLLILGLVIYLKATGVV